MKRRQLIALGLGFGGASFFYYLKPSISKKAIVNHPFLVGAFSPHLKNVKSDTEKYFTPDISGQISLYNLINGKLTIIPSPFHPHQMFQSPIQPQIFAGVARWGNGGGVFNLETRQMVSQLIPPKDHRFFGHGAFSIDGQKLYISGNNNSNTEGKVFFYEVRSGQYLGQFSSGGIYPHECFINKYGHLFITNFKRNYGESGGGISQIDAESGKIIEHFSLKSATHMQSIDRSHVSIGSSNLDSDLATWIVFNLSEAKIVKNFLSIYKNQSIKFVGEALSLLTFNSDVQICTNNMGRKLTAWNWKNDTFISWDFDDRTLGLARHEDNLFVTLGLSGDLYQIQFDKNRFVFGQPKLIKKNFSNSSHLTI